MFCGNCGKPVPDGVKFCANCGNPVDTANVSTQQVYQQPVYNAQVQTDAPEQEIMSCKAWLAEGSAAWRDGKCRLTNKRLIFYKGMNNGLWGGIGGGVGALAVCLGGIVGGIVIGAIVFVIFIVIFALCYAFNEPKYDFEVAVSDITGIHRGSHGLYSNTLVIEAKNAQTYEFLMRSNTEMMDSYIKQLIKTAGNYK